MSGPKSRTRETTGKKGTEQQTELVGRVNSSSPHGDASSNQVTAASLAKVLEEIRDFRQDISAEEVTTDMKNRGLPINVFRAEPKEDLAAQLSRTSWERVEARGRRVATST